MLSVSLQSIKCVRLSWSGISTYHSHLSGNIGLTFDLLLLPVELEGILASSQIFYSSHEEARPKNLLNVVN